MATIRVTIGEMPPLLRSLVEGVLDEDPKFEIASDRVPDGAAVPAEREVRVLVVSEEAMMRVVPISSALPARMGLVAIAPGGLEAAVVHLSAHRRRIDREPRQTLAQAILDAARAVPGTR